MWKIDIFYELFRLRDGLDFSEKNAIKLIFLERINGVCSFYELKGEAHGRVA